MNRESFREHGSHEPEAFDLGSPDEIRVDAEAEIQRLEALIATEPDSKARERWKIQLQALKDGIETIH